MGIEGGNEENKGNEPSTTPHLVKPADNPTDTHCKGTVVAHICSRQTLANSRYMQKKVTVVQYYLLGSP